MHFSGYAPISGGSRERKKHIRKRVVFTFKITVSIQKKSVGREGLVFSKIIKLLPLKYLLPPNGLSTYMHLVGMHFQKPQKVCTTTLKPRYSELVLSDPFCSLY